MNYWERGLLQVSNNKKYLENGETPFFWLGDTAWLLFHQLSLKEAHDYLKNRKEKGYNVILATLIHVMPEEYNDSLANAMKDERYWQHCDQIIQMAEELGLYMGLLPTWGSIVKQNILNVDNVEEYAKFLGNRYLKNPNVIWILGGDIRGNKVMGVYPTFGKILKGLNPDKLIGFHPFGRTSSSLWFHEDEWLDFNMFQSGHRRYDQQSLGEWDDNKERETFFGEDNWRYVTRDHSYELMKPTVDGEPSYEWIPQGLHDPKEPFWQAWDARRYAYWSVFQGAMGHTYGDNAIMQFYNGVEGTGNYGVKETWQDSMHHEGGNHMKHLFDLMNSVDFINGYSAEHLLISGQKEKYDRISVFAGPDYLFCYDYNGKEFTLDLSGYQGKTLYAYWFDPTSGVYSYFENMTGKKSVVVKPVTRFAGHNDWVLVIRNW